MAYTIRKTTIPSSGIFRDESTIIRGKEGKRIILLFTGEGCTKFTRIFWV